MYYMEAIGIVRNTCKSPDEAESLKKQISIIEVDEKYSEALYKTGVNEYLDIVFYFHKSPESKAASWRGRTITGEEKGAFASRSPRRPNAIGVTTVRLHSRDGNRLRVSGLDAIDGTPVLDIKAPSTSHIEDFEAKSVHASVLKSSPRISQWKCIRAGDTEKLLLQVGQLHGHYCPGLAMGVMAATYAMQHLRIESDGLEDVLAIVETNNCLADGVQWVTGCSFGNNSLIFHDVGKTAFTLTRRDGNGIRVISRPESQDYIKSSFPEFDEYYNRVVVQQSRDDTDVEQFKKSGVERSFGTLQLEFDRLFDTEWVTSSIPDYAPSHKSVVCSQCEESVMASRVVESGGRKHCLVCAGASYAVLDGHGIHPGNQDREKFQKKPL